MLRSVSTKKPAAEDPFGTNDASVTEASVSGLHSPRAERQRTWSKRADDNAVAIRLVQQLLHQHAAEAGSAKQALDQATSTAALLWTMEIEGLPPQYRNKSRPASQRGGSAAGGRGNSNTEQRVTPRQSHRAGSSTSTAEGTAAATGEAAPETVESTVRQLTAAQRSKVSSALRALFYAPAAAAAVTPTAIPTVTSADPHVSGKKGELSSPELLQQAAAGEHSQPTTVTLLPPHSSPSPAAAGISVTDSDFAVLSDSGRRSTSCGIIPAPLLTAMRELQERRIQLEAQLAAANSATAQQLQRLQLLQEEAMVVHYALDAFRDDAAHLYTHP
ncbi:hypothetical protein ABL78_7411 [Leptomonas seymouri]|uniref:Uncharacterized protein n=1 Tax=Leptomonas seymouri TaxID=5684 RepID=A0A0N1PBH1_LEPSE|nr:hypothetical protein ABL78_7411 [Leptomonas seymouri]|eukprot:KPI83554.1 hypothetical protein ABL78_7411 [Leptomonas seymouri]